MHKIPSLFIIAALALGNAAPALGQTTPPVLVCTDSSGTFLEAAKDPTFLGGTNRSVSLKLACVDSAGKRVDASYLAAKGWDAPIVVVTRTGIGVAGEIEYDASKTTPSTLTRGEDFVYSGGYWVNTLDLRPYVASGEYTISAVARDSSQYTMRVSKVIKK